MDKNDRVTQYVIDCLRSAIAYCKQQYEDSVIDWLPTINFIDSTLDESAKFKLADDFLSNLMNGGDCK